MALNCDRGNNIKMEKRKIVLKNIPPTYDTDLLKDYVEGTLELDVLDINIVPYIPGRALVTLGQDLQDINAANELTKQSTVEGKVVTLLETHKKPAIVVSDLNIGILSEDFLKLYLESTFADGYDAVHSCQTWPDYHLATVHFSTANQEVVDAILVETDHIPLPSENYHIKISHFYSNFHDYIDQPVDETSTSEDNAQENKVFRGTKFDHTIPTQTVAADSIRKEDEVDDVDEDSGSKMEEEFDGDDEDDNAAADDLSDDNDDEKSSRDDDGNNIEDSGGKNNSFELNENFKTYQTAFRGRGGSHIWIRGNCKKKIAGNSFLMNKESQREHSLDENVDTTLQKRSYSSRGRGYGNFRGGFSRQGKTPTNENHGGDELKYKEDGCKLKSFSHRSSSDNRGRPPRSDTVFGQIKMSNSNDLPSSWDSSISVNEHCDKSRNRRDFSMPCYENDDDDQCGNANPDLIDDSTGLSSPRLPSRNSESDLGHSKHGSSFNPGIGSRGGRGRAFVWANSKQQTGMSFNRKLSFQEGRINDNSSSNSSNKAQNVTIGESNSEISKRFLCSVQAEASDTEELSLDKNKEQLTKLTEEASITVKTAMEMTVLQEKFLKHLFSDFNDCHLYYDISEKVLVFIGTNRAIKDCQTKLMLEMKKIKEDTITLSSDMHFLLSSEKGRRYLESLNSSGLNGAMVELEHLSLLVAAKDEKILSVAVKKLKAKLDFSTTIRSEVEIPLEKLNSLKLTTCHNFLVHVFFDDDRKVIKLLGVEDDVLLARRDFENLLEEFGVYEKSFNANEPVSRFLHLMLKDKMKSILSSVQVSDFISTETKISIRFKGQEYATAQVLRKLQDLKNDVLSVTWNLLDDFTKHEVYLIGKSIKNGQMKEKLEIYKLRDMCLVVPNMSDVAPKLLSPKKRTKPSLSSKTATTDDAIQAKHVKSNVLPPQSLLKFDIANSCHLVIKSDGDIVQEKSEVLVSVLGPDRHLRETMVGRAFNEACPSHWKELKVVKDSSPGAHVLTVQKPKNLNCLAVCHVVLAPWNPRTSPHQLDVAIQTVLSEAKRIGAKSISFPALGCGRAFQFPPSNVAQQVLASIRSMNVGKFLNEVVILAPDQKLFKEFISEALSHFKAAAPTRVAFPPLPVPSARSVVKDESEDESDGSEDLLDVSSINDLNNPNGHITIYTSNGVEFLKSVKNKIKRDIREQCLYVEYYQQSLMTHWPKESWHRILNEGITSTVWVERAADTETRGVGFKLTGEKPAVAKMLSFIQNEFHFGSSHLPKRRLPSDQAPKRGTLDFLRYAAESDECFPSYWSLNASRSFWKNVQKKMTRKKHTVLVDVGKETMVAINDLVAKTLDLQFVGHGNDATGLQYSNIKIVDVKRVENPHLFEIYRLERKRLFEQMAAVGHICTDIEKIPGSKGRVATSEQLSESMKKELYYEVNEHYLFHGTKSDIVDTLTNSGLDPKISSEAAMFGRGIYAAEKFTKSDQYTDCKQKRSPNGTDLTIILTRMLLGNVFICDSNHKSVQGKDSKKLIRPPCMTCLQDVCKCKHQNLYDSVMGDGKWLFREFVVYEKNQGYPEYVIKYRRV